MNYDTNGIDKELFPPEIREKASFQKYMLKEYTQLCKSSAYFTLNLLTNHQQFFGWHPVLKAHILLPCPNILLDSCCC